MVAQRGRVEVEGELAREGVDDAQPAQRDQELPVGLRVVDGPAAPVIVTQTAAAVDATREEELGLAPLRRLARRLRGAVHQHAEQQRSRDHAEYPPHAPTSGRGRPAAAVCQCREV